ncbi:MAG: VOC family protein [Flavitalea sp.]
MATLHPYLNFDGNALEAFEFYKSVFGGEFISISKMSDAPGGEKLSDNEKNRIMHIALPLQNGVILMASDIVPSAGQVLKVGNNNYLSLNTESREEAASLFSKLSAGGTIEMPLEDTFWGDYFGCFADKFGVNWMVSFGSYKKD